MTGHASKSTYIHKVRTVGATFIEELSLKSILEKWIESEIFLLSYIDEVGSLTPLGHVKLIISFSFPSVPTLTRGGWCDHMIATTNWHFKIRKWGYKLNRWLYGQTSDGSNGYARLWQNYTCLADKWPPMAYLCTTHRNQYGIFVWDGWLDLVQQPLDLSDLFPMTLHVHRTWITNPSIMSVHNQATLSCISVHFTCSFMNNQWTTSPL